MKFAASILGVTVFFIVGVVCLESHSTGWAFVSWIVSSLFVTLSLMANRAREEKKYENKMEEERMIKELEITNDATQKTQ